MEGWIKLHPWKFKCQRILPIIYDESLSLYENVCKLTRLVNDLIHDVDLLEQEISNLPEIVRAEVERQVTALRNELVARMDALENQMRMLEKTISDEVDERNAEMKQYVDQQVAVMRGEIDSALAQVNLAITNVNVAMRDMENRLNFAIGNLQSQINDIYDMLGKEGGYLKNPITGETGEQNDVFAWVYNKLRVPHTMRIGDIEVSDITYGEVHDMGLSCWQVSILDKLWDLPDLYNPVTGQKDKLQNILNAMYNSETMLPNWRYSKLDITTQDIADSEITCSDWRENQNWLNVDMVKTYRQYANGTWEGEVFTNAPAETYNEENAYVSMAVLNSTTIDQMGHMDCTAIDNLGDYYHLTEPYATVKGGILYFNIVVPKGLYGKLIALKWRAWVRVQQ